MKAFIGMLMAGALVGVTGAALAQTPAQKDLSTGAPQKGGLDRA